MSKDLITADLETRIYTIRGQKVMLDSDLSELYGVETSALNRQVKRNIDLFPADFMMRLTEREFQALICQIGISNNGCGGRRKLPEQPEETRHQISTLNARKGHNFKCRILCLS